VFTLGSKTFFAGAGLAALLSIVYAANTTDQAGTMLLVGAVFALIALGCAVLFGAGASDRFSYDGQADQRPARESKPTLVPFMAALGAGAIVVGFALGASYLGLGLVAAAVCAAVWFSQAWRDHPDYVAKLTNRVSGYVGLPFGMPVAMVALIGFIAISVSRTLLAVTHTQAWVIAIVIAAAVFVCGLILASRPNITKKAMAFAVAVGAAIILGLGVYGQVKGEHKSTESHESGSHEETVTEAAADSAA
jgi:multisubunit Na+/H+ antiporter MnhC subunit